MKVRFTPFSALIGAAAASVSLGAAHASPSPAAAKPARAETIARPTAPVAGARQIDGYIRNQAGGPLQGYRVLAYDDDPGSDDFMGSAITDGNGYYLITYADKHWDPSLPGTTNWRPDIYVLVQVRNQFGLWVNVRRTNTQSNQRLREGLTINANINVPAPVTKSTGFSPATYGFHFANSFVVTPSVLGLPSEIAGVAMPTWKQGFCGGMAAGALNRFNRKIAAPSSTTTPSPGTPLYNELEDRQRKTVSLSTLLKIVTWQASPDTSQTLALHSVGYRTKQEWPALRARIDAGKPTVLVLIRAEGAANPSENHQVLAYGYTWTGETQDLVIQAYDPNYRDQTVLLRMNFGLPNNNIHARQSTGERLRGFFVNSDGDKAAQ